MIDGDRPVHRHRPPRPRAGDVDAGQPQRHRRLDSRARRGREASDRRGPSADRCADARGPGPARRGGRDRRLTARSAASSRSTRSAGCFRRCCATPAAPAERLATRISSSAIWTALVAAPLRRLSATTNIDSAFGCDSSRRTRPTKTSSRPSERSGDGTFSRISPGACESSSSARSTRDRLARLDVDRLRVADPDRHAHAGDGDADRLVLEDLAGLEHHLALLVGVIVAVDEVAGRADHVEGDVVRVDRRRRHRLAVQRGAGLGVELSERLLAGAGHRLVGRDDQPLDPDLTVDRRERDHQLHRRAVRVGDQAVVALAARAG